jgi:hypothetical protein
VAKKSDQEHDKEDENGAAAAVARVARAAARAASERVEREPPPPRVGKSSQGYTTRSKTWSGSGQGYDGRQDSKRSAPQSAR